MTAIWETALDHYVRVLTVRLREMEDQLPEDRFDPAWREYRETGSAVREMIAFLKTEPQPKPLSRRELAERFKKAGGG